MALSYSGAHIAPEPVDHMKVRANAHGIPVNRSARNSDTVSRVDHGAAGVSAGAGNWQAHRAAYMASTTEQMRREDQGHLESLWQDMRQAGVHEHAIQHVQRYVGMRAAFDPSLIKFIRAKFGSKQTLGDEHDGDRAAGRAAEMAAGHQPRAATPTHPKADTRAAQQTKPNVLHRFTQMLGRNG